MTWRGSSTPTDRLLSSLVYLLPVMEALPFGIFLFSQIPVLVTILSPLFYLRQFYDLSVGGLAIVPLLAFFGLFLGVVRNSSCSHLLRFNAMQALLITIGIYLGEILLQILGITQILSLGFADPQSHAPILLVVFFQIIFLGTIALCGYSTFFALQGLYGEVPVISEAAYRQTRY